MLFQILILFINQIQGQKLFEFELNSFDIRHQTLEFKVVQKYLQIDLGCDLSPSKIWTSYDSQSIIVKPEDRKAAGCDDHYFSLWIQDLQTVDFQYTINVYNFYTRQLIQELKFLYDQSYHYKEYPQENIATYNTVYDSKDFIISLSTKAFVYVEIFQSEFSMKELTIKQVNPNNQYRDVISDVEFWFYDIFEAQPGNYYYRIEDQSKFQINFFFKYQILTDKTKPDIYQLKQSQTPTAKYKRNKIFLNIPSLDHYYQSIYYKVMITSSYNASTKIARSFGDEELMNKQNLTNDYVLYYYDSHQQVATDYSDQFRENVQIYVFGFIQHPNFNQTIPFNNVYLAKIEKDNHKLIYILPPTIVLAFAIVSILFGYYIFKKKSKSMQQDPQNQLWNQKLIKPIIIGNIQ